MKKQIGSSLDEILRESMSRSLFGGMTGSEKDREERKVAGHVIGEVLISTMEVYDGEKPFETAVGHPEYNEGKVVIVQAHDAREKAIKGHEKWKKKMTSPKLPAALKDCSNSFIKKDLVCARSLEIQINRRVGIGLVS